MKNSRVNRFSIMSIKGVYALLLVMLFSNSSVMATPDDWTHDSNLNQAEATFWMANALSCKPSVQISLDQAGLADVVPSMLVNAPDYPLNQYEVDIMGPLADIVSCAEIGQEVMAVVEEIPTGNTCMSSLIVQDKLKPMLTCEGDSLPCNVLIDTINFENFIDVLEDNCDNDLDLFHTYSVTNVDCNPNNIIAFIKVNWTATDDYNNSTSCADTIFLIKPSIDDVVFPNDTAISCEDGNIDPQVIGGPTVLGGPIDHTCKLIAWHNDNPISMCSGMTKVIRIWNVMDWCTGETRTEMQEILIEDNVGPVVVCPPSEVVSTNQLTCFANYTLPSPVSVVDACSDPALIDVRVRIEGVLGIYEPGDLVQLNIGSYDITIEAIDDCLNVGQCVYTVTVVDDVMPTAVCSGITTGIGANGFTTIQANELNFNPDDNCGVEKVEIARMTDPCNIAGNLDFGNFITLCCADVGDSIFVLYRVTDINGNQNTCMFGIGVKDALPPVAICQDVTLSIDSPNSVTVDPDDVNNMSTDNCEIDTIYVTPNSFDCDDIGIQSVVLTVEDASGNSDTCIANVKVEDTEPPMALCNNLIRDLNDMGMVTITTAEVNGGSMDNCQIDTMFISKDKFGCLDIGPNNVTLTVVDTYGNEATCNSVVTIQEQPPTALCQDTVFVSLDQFGMDTITVAEVNNMSTDDCGIDTMTLDKMIFGCDDFGLDTVTLIVTDVTGNSSTCTSIVKIEDNLGPNCMTQDITVYLDATGNVNFMSTDIDDMSEDNCSGLNFTAQPMSFTCAEIGNQPVNLVVTDIMGNESICSAIVTVVDTISPVCNASDVTVELDGNGNGSVSVNDVNNNSTDNCNIDMFSVTPNTFGCPDAGTTVVVTLTVTDQSSNASSCTANVAVKDLIAPNAICQDVTIFLDGMGNASVLATQVEDDPTDNCPGPFGLSLDQTDFGCSNIGPNTVTLTVTDQSGNTATCSATVTVVDDEDPDAECQNTSVMLDANGSASITTADINSGTTDNCSFILSVEPNTFGCLDVGLQMVVLTATDPSNNTDTCHAFVNVMENVLPSAMCKDTTLFLDINGMASIAADDLDDGSSDNCGMVSVSISDVTFDCMDIGPNNVTLTVTDMAMNESTCISVVTVQDTTSPDANCTNLMVSLNANGMISVTAMQVNSNSTDNCGVQSFSLDITDFGCNDLGPNPVVLTVLDVNGNSDNCQATITVIDDLDPVADCMDINVMLDGNGNATITAEDVSNMSTDNCSFVLTASPLTFDCTNVGPNNVELIATDPSMNADTCIAIVTVTETVNLDAVCQDTIVALDENGLATITADDIDAGSTSSCAIPDITIDITDFDCGDLGPNQIQLTATAGNNSDMCIATVTIIDTLDPVAVCADLTIYLDENGDASITTGEVGSGSSDNCPIDFSLNMTAFDCGNVGENTVTLTVVDEATNSSTCDATIWVRDSIAPTCATMDFTVSLDGNGNATITVNDVNAGSVDNCTPVTFGLTPTSFTCMDLGPNVVTLSPQDPAGNTSMCTAVVKVIDENNLVANCQSITAELDADGMVTVDAGMVNNGSGGGCMGLDIMLSLTPTSFTCMDIGPNMVTLTVTDTENNSATCTATVTVVDNIDPVITCPPNVNANCGDIEDPNDLSQFLDPVATDNCGTPLVTNTSNIGTLDNCGVGSIVRNFMATDGSGNTDQCSYTITILNPDPFTEDDINYPPAVIELTGCAPTDPDDIPGSQPTLDVGPNTCSPPTISFEDSNITITTDNDPNTPCLMFTRTWTIIDSCALEPGTQNGIYPFVQTISVNDSSPPQFAQVNDIVATATDANCDVFVPLVVNTADCSNVTYTNDSPFGGNGGNDASGVFPFGTTTVTFTATDECGNISTLTVNVTVNEEVDATFDCVKIIENLPQELEIIIHARDFVAFVDGTCTDIDDYLFSYSPNNPFDSLRIFDCGDVGVTTRSLWFFNLNGAVIGTCTTADLELRDDMDFCMDGMIVEGDIESEEGFAVTDAEVSIMEMSMPPVITAINGQYSIDSLSVFGQYTIMPKRDFNDLEGVSTLDLVMMQKHLLGIKRLDSPYKMIAADINKSGNISGIDLLELRKLLLGIYIEFPQNESWRFVDEAFIFPDPFDPFMTEFPESVYLNSLSTPLTIVNFVGMKVGDVNGSYFNFNAPIQVNNRTIGTVLNVQDQIATNNHWIDIPLYLKDVEEMIGLQFELEFDQNVEWELGSTDARFDESHIAMTDHKLIISWNDVQNISFDAESPLMTIRLNNQSASTRLSDLISMPNEKLQPELYIDSEQVDISPLSIEWKDVRSEEYALFQNRPNPFSDGTTIEFSLPHETNVTIEVFDAAGQRVHLHEQLYQPGRHQLNLDATRLSKSGVYYCTMKTADFAASRKMIMIE